MRDDYFYETASGHGLPHDPIKAIVAPRPIGWISTIDAEGRINLAPYSYFNAVCNDPPMVMFSSNGRKDSVRNIEQTGAFACNLVTRDLAQAMNETSRSVAPEVDEMAMAGLTAAPCRLIAAPRVAEAHAVLECQTLAIHALADLGGRPVNQFMVIGQVVGVHIDKMFLKEGLFDTAGAGVIARCGYASDYAAVDPFQMSRPR
ncbi:flavin reductase family protein [Rhodospirillum rubrum]|uniref:Flavin reductase like domain-containing protein n=1 Tax=Rhodospirillum rubrum (strain ATCC 11170 / ATH 1.1.1 / DSM 467 / LMG 4362 / NCIMB 8255 / S1) TaxID=269796 RepID=Q2RR17_RHORT|nr:flavin reductase family protein [Rhodospirillum rubrum]ABC23428.1 conserved hypothetical protein [Rhodospirillum rubrum ATCC 11170]AEO49166.1 hypothetical protein F11_13520 [Rhodospirillum rubrum F11]MBK5955098.1 Asp/Glu/hydantoin racemase [Rhodospirillum rubrum]QXG79399.1 flavin reductase family protein [Rhodospirillum rubrum]HAP98591.1 flavin reductase family protein [Rhodospirillum rubrum]